VKLPFQIGRRILSVVAVGAIIAAAALAPRANAGERDTALARLFPKDTAAVAYIDLKAAHEQPWFDLAERNLLPLRLRKITFQLANAGLDPHSQVETLAWGTLSAGKSGAGQILGVAFGHFSQIGVEDYWRDHKVPPVELRGVRVFDMGGAGGGGDGDLYLGFLDASTIVFGQPDALDKLLAVYYQGEPSLAENSALVSQIRAARADSIAWAVWNKDFSSAALRQLLPGIAESREAAQLLKGIDSMELDATNQDGLSAQSQIVCASRASAASLAAILQLGLAYRQRESQAANPGFSASIFGDIRVSADGNIVQITIPLGSEQLTSALLGRNLLNLLQ
jgi:hypothetical protein